MSKDIGLTAKIVAAVLLGVIFFFLYMVIGEISTEYLGCWLRL